MSAVPASIRSFVSGNRKVFVVLDSAGRVFVRPSGALAWFLSVENARAKVGEGGAWRAVVLTAREVEAGLRGEIVAPPAKAATPRQAEAPVVAPVAAPVAPSAPAPVPVQAPARMVGFVTPPPAPKLAAPAVEAARVAVVHFWTDGSIRSPQGEILGDVRKDSPSPEARWVKGFWVKPKR